MLHFCCLGISSSEFVLKFVHTLELRSIIINLQSNELYRVTLILFKKINQNVSSKNHIQRINRPSGADKSWPLPYKGGKLPVTNVAVVVLVFKFVMDIILTMFVLLIINLGCQISNLQM